MREQTFEILVLPLNRILNYLVIIAKKTNHEIKDCRKLKCKRERERQKSNELSSNNNSNSNQIQLVSKSSEAPSFLSSVPLNSARTVENIFTQWHFSIDQNPHESSN